MDSETTTKFVPEHRRTNFKNKSRFESDELRRRRETQQIELRKQKRDETLSKRRFLNDPNMTSLLNNDDSDDEDDDNYNSNELNFMQSLELELPGLMDQINLTDFSSQLQATVRFRQILSREHNPPIDIVIKSGVVPTLVKFMGDEFPDLLQLEAAWALTNIASGTSDQTKVVIEAGAVPQFVHLLLSPSLELKEQAIWALGNVAGDSSTYRDYVLGCNAMPSILELFNSPKISLIRTASWTLSNLCRGKNPSPDWQVVAPALPALAKLVYCTDSEALVDACWAVSYLSDGAYEAIQAVIDARIPKRLVELLGHDSNLVKTPALRAIGNLVTGNDLQTQQVINCGVLPALVPLFTNSKESIRKETCWTISNITAGNVEQIQAVIDNNLIPPLVKVLESGEYKTKKEACWAISNASSGGLTKPEIIQYLVQQGCIKPLCDLLVVGDNKIIEITLDALENILKMGELQREYKGINHNEYALFIEEAGGLDKIFECQKNENENIYKKSYDIIDKYFNEDDEDDAGIDDIAPVNNGNSFGFNAEAPQGGFNF